MSVLNSRKVFEVQGADKMHFFQGIITADVSRCLEGLPAYGTLLTPTGRFLAELFLYPVNEDVWLLDVLASTSDELLCKLNAYKLRSDVHFSETDLVVVAKWPTDPNIDRKQVDPRLKELGKRKYQKPEHVLDPKPESEYVYHRISLGVADCNDLLPSKSIILEANFEHLNAISFSKGCYVGQELMARTKHQGVIRKQILPAKIVGHDSLPFLEPIFADKEEVGTVRSCENGLAMVYLNLDFASHDDLYTEHGIKIAPWIPNWHPKLEG